MGALRVYNGTTWETVGGVGATGAAGADGNGTLLARVERTATTASSYSIASATAADVDATNLAVTFTAPASGSVLVYFYLPSAPASGVLQVFLRNGTTNVAGTMRGGGATSNYASPSNASFSVTGLTPGTSYTYKLGARTYQGGTVFLYYGYATNEFTNTAASAGAIVMEVWSA